jgi:hypothetical protein
MLSIERPSSQLRSSDDDDKEEEAASSSEHSEEGRTANSGARKGDTLDASEVEAAASNKAAAVALELSVAFSAPAEELSSGSGCCSGAVAVLASASVRAQMPTQTSKHDAIWCIEYLLR